MPTHVWRCSTAATSGPRWPKPLSCWRRSSARTWNCKTQPPAPRPGGLFTKDRFDVDLDADTVTCPNEVTVSIRRGRDGITCPQRSECTNAEAGRTIRVGVYEQRLADARAQQQDPDWVDDYRATRPKVERKLGHLMRRRHGGRRARVRGKRKVDADFTSAPPAS